MEGARFRNYTDFTSYLNAVFSPELAESYANSARYDEKMNIYAGGYMQGENDELWFTGGERRCLFYIAEQPLRSRNCSLTAA